jgi:hypothetical protein
MYQKDFFEILKEMLIPSIDKTAKAIGGSAACEIGEKLKDLVCELKVDLYNEYQYRRNEFKVNYMRGGKKSRINRHKIAALFYISSINIIGKKNFFKPKNELKYFFAHNAIFNAAIGIIEAFIYFGEEKHGHNLEYCSYVKKNGIVAQDSEYKFYDIKKIILAHKNNELSELQLFNIFSSIENNISI